MDSNSGFTPPHAIEGVLKQLPGKWISNAHLTHYQALLLDAPRVHFQTPCFLNPAILLCNPEKDHLHDCSEILVEALASQKDLTDVLLNNSELVWFTDGSSYVKGRWEPLELMIQDRQYGLRHFPQTRLHKKQSSLP